MGRTKAAGTMAVAGGHWRKLVNQVRAGKRLRPKTWKNGARCAFAISFDSDHETNELREGGKSIGRMAWGQYGNRVGRAAHPRTAEEARRARRRSTFRPSPPCSIPTSSAR